MTAAAHTCPRNPAPFSVVDTNSAVASGQVPTRYSDQVSTTAPCSSTPGTPSSRVRTRYSRTVARTRSPSTSARWARSAPVAAASFTVCTDSRTEPSAVPNRALASAAIRPERPANGAPIAATPAQTSRNPPMTAAARTSAATSPATTTTITELVTSTQRST